MRLFFLSGEPSGDLYGSFVIKAIKEKRPEVEIFCVGGEELESAGAVRIMDNKDLSVVGFWEGAKASFRLWRLKERLRKEILTLRPSVFLPLSFSSFALPLVKELREGGFNQKVKIIYISPPQVWAWGKGRVKYLKRYVDKVICLLPFEEEFLRSCGINAFYFGNPLTEFVKPKLSREDIVKQYATPIGKKVICLTPGSRKEEVERHLPFLLELFSLLNKEKTFFGFVLLPAALKSKKADYTGEANCPDLVFSAEDKYDLITLSELVIGKLGTISLETVLLGRPYVGIYIPNLISYIAGRFIVKTRLFSLPNILLREKAFPEFIRPNIEDVKKTIERILANKGIYEADCLKVRRVLEREGVKEKIVEAVLNL